MLITITLLSVIVVASYVALQPRVETLPANVPFRHESWMNFVPTSAQFVAYVNYRTCIEASGNQSLFGTDPLLETYLPAFTLYPNSIEYELAINLPSEGSKEDLPTVIVLKIGSQELKGLQEAVQSAEHLHTTTHSGYTIFNLLVRHKERQTQFALAALAIAHEHILLAEGTGITSSMNQILDTADHEPSQLFSLESTRAALYASGGSDSYLAFFAATFPTQIEAATIVMKTVKGASESATSQIAFAFQTEDKARSHYQAVKNLYSGGSDYWILSEFVVVKFNHQMSELGQQIRGL